MRPRILHELSRHLATRIEESLRSGGEIRVPVFQCHPLEATDDTHQEAERATGVLYLYRVSPEAPRRHATMTIESAQIPGDAHRLQSGGLGLRLRFVFLVVGGTQDDELAVLGQVLQSLYSRPYVAVADLEGVEIEDSVDLFPLKFIDDPLAWQEIGLGEHRLSVSFEIAVYLPAGGGEMIDPIVEREVEISRFPGGSS